MMGRAHSYAYAAAPVMRTLPVRPRLRLISGRDEAKVSEAAAAYGVEGWVTDWQELVQRPEVDIADICTPPGTHADIANASIAAGNVVAFEQAVGVHSEQVAGIVEAASNR